MTASHHRWQELRLKGMQETHQEQVCDSHSHRLCFKDAEQSERHHVAVWNVQKPRQSVSGQLHVESGMLMLKRKHSTGT